MLDRLPGPGNRWQMIPTATCLSVQHRWRNQEQTSPSCIPASMQMHHPQGYPVQGPMGRQPRRREEHQSSIHSLRSDESVFRRLPHSQTRRRTGMCLPLRRQSMFRSLHSPWVQAQDLHMFRLRIVRAKRCGQRRSRRPSWPPCRCPSRRTALRSAECRQMSNPLSQHHDGRIRRIQADCLFPQQAN